MKRLQWTTPPAAGEHYAIEDEGSEASPGGAASHPLHELRPGTQAVVQGIDGGYGILDRLSALGLVPGTCLQILRNPRRGPILIQIHNTRVAVGRGQAHKVRTAPLGEPLTEEGRWQ
ncbi:FeoA family protein [Halorhodospira neutriphila]|uniref:Ferrous iron transporter FeoA-like domain-containing protein n=1 Tax=Halorhodospira neutriphila TaxID=168379 RepID=A0ABS1E5L2_9GAMM|nr:FeoA family protein [Halorhodospira neutriphila]MBK1726417.1 hypothetical protein [Halorhodospira neutriphila]